MTIYIICIDYSNTKLTTGSKLKLFQRPFSAAVFQKVAQSFLPAMSRDPSRPWAFPKMSLGRSKDCFFLINLISFLSIDILVVFLFLVCSCCFLYVSCMFNVAKSCWFRNPWMVAQMFLIGSTLSFTLDESVIYRDINVFQAKNKRAPNLHPRRYSDTSTRKFFTMYKDSFQISKSFACIMIKDRYRATTSIRLCYQLQAVWTASLHLMLADVFTVSQHCYCSCSIDILGLLP